MESRNKQKAVEKFVPPHSHFSSYSARYIEKVMEFTYVDPYQMKKCFYITGGVSVALASTAFIPSIPRPIRGVASILGITGAVLSIASGYIQQNVFGFPIDNEPAYQNNSYRFGKATAELHVDDGYVPRLDITSHNHYDAGFVEGYILGSAIQVNLDAISPLFDLVKFFVGSPKEARFKAYFDDILHVIPSNYVKEMQGKVDGYNTWLKEKNQKTNPLIFEHYVFLQTIADYRNFIPFKDCPFAPFFHNIGCTTFALRVGKTTVFSRTLDWVAYDKVKYFIEINRNISGSKRTADLAHVLLSGALTVVSENFLCQINVANGENVTHKPPQGMPAVLFTRDCAAKVSNTSDLIHFLKDNRPLSAFNLTVSDGHDTQSIRLLQDLKSPSSKHVINQLSTNEENPQLMVVANMGIEKKDDKFVPFNFRESKQREENLFAFFKQPAIQKQLSQYIEKQHDQKILSKDDMNALLETVANAARLPLVCSAASVILAIYVFENEKLNKAIVAMDNSFAPRKDLDEFRRLRL
jgi:hypothetical protein